MLGYVVTRLLLIVPKFFLISLVVFGLLNLTAGPPPAPDAGDARAGAQTTNQNYISFKRQFYLDKPVLWNTRWATTDAEVAAWLKTAANLAGDVSIADRHDAFERLDDYGNDLVVHLIPLLTDPDPDLRRAAMVRLAVAARRRPLDLGTAAPDVVRAANARIAEESARFRTWTGEDGADVSATVARWAAWWSENEAFYQYTPARKVHTFFFQTRFARYWHNLLRLDLGESSATRQPVLGTILQRAPISVALSLVSITLAYLVALPIGLYSAARPGSPLDSGATVTVFLLYSLPSFFTGTLLLMLLATGADRVFPSGGFVTADTSGLTRLGLLRDVAGHLVLPVLTYTSAALASLSRYARSGILDVIRADYVRTARAKGLSEWVVIVRHAARNGMLPILTLLGGLLPALVGGSVIVETVFNIPGMGNYLYTSTVNHDYNAVMGVLLLSSLLTLVGIFLSDLSYALVDPRISYA